MSHILTVITHPHQTLLIPTKPISADVLRTPEIQTLIDRMIPTMHHEKGVGIAAPQVDRSLRICVIARDAILLDHKTTIPHEDLVLVNPVWNRLSKKTDKDVEGCLSIPHTFGTVKRYTEISVDALDRQGNPLSFEARGFFARVIQHEVDHLEGILFISKATNIRIDTP